MDEIRQIILGNPNFIVETRLSINEVLSFEREYKISLPSQYRKFVTTIGKGLKYLNQTILIDFNPNNMFYPPYADSQYADQCRINFRKDFPYTDIWNVPKITLEEWLQQKGEDRWADDHIKYFSNDHISGTIPLRDVGCGIVEILILRGQEKGNIWMDDRYNYQGIYPLKIAQQQRADFKTWLINMIKLYTDKIV